MENRTNTELKTLRRKLKAESDPKTKSERTRLRRRRKSLKNRTKRNAARRSSDGD